VRFDVEQNIPRKNDNGEVMAMSRHKPGLPDNEAKKLKNK
jgi:hypothetical protein